MKSLSLLLPILALTAAIITPKAATADPADYTYTVSCGEATITGYTERSGSHLANLHFTPAPVPAPVPAAPLLTSLFPHPRYCKETSE